MSEMTVGLLSVLANGWLAGLVLLLLVLAVDRPAFLPPRARHLVVLGSLAATVLLAVGVGAGWGRAAVRAAGGGGLLQDAEVPLEAGSSAAWLVPAWAVVAAALLAREAAGHGRLRRLRADWRPAAPAARAAAGWHGAIPLLTGADGAPLALGLLCPAVYLPERCFRDLTPAGLRAITAHERAHARWRDPTTWALARLARILLWPVAPLWVLERRLHRTAEEAADAEATAGAGGEARAEYCRTLLAVSCWRSPGAPRSPAPAIASGRLESRLRAVLRPRRPGRRGVVAATVAALPTLALLATLPWARPESPHGGSAAAPSGAVVDREILLDRLREVGVEVSEEGEDRIRIVIPEGDERVQEILREAVVAERRD